MVAGIRKQTTTGVHDTRLATILSGVNVAIGKKSLSQSLTFQERRCLEKLSKYIDTAEKASKPVPYPVWLTPQYWEQVRHLRCLETTIPDDNPRLLISELRTLVINITQGNLIEEYVNRYRTILSSASNKLMKSGKYNDSFDFDAE